ncbi:uncharacterized protein FIBRA_07032 [Fibroporia radiculosa]|uniref:MYND-type domain-containing protein n=1 Tax=Fibroporia radiculosa TaxID=599839 RepID=J4H4E2_9APHY|nr:uncharacterized protein FIBRA_07032 [Fibroporia radiculosa]CCM04839.1 predicted protein [Fibroporia radiculosa]
MLISVAYILGPIPVPLQSKECQKSDWPKHKKICAKVVAIAAEHAEEGTADRHKALATYCEKHLQYIGLFSIKALDIVNDPTRSERELVVIWVHSRPGRCRPETAFVALEANTADLDLFGSEYGDQFRARMRSTAADTAKLNKTGLTHSLIVVVVSLDDSIWVYHCVEYPLKGLGPLFMNDPQKGPWKESMFHLMNNGIVR